MTYFIAEFNYVAEDPQYTFQCCAVITEWRVVPGKVGTIQLQVWRRLSNNNYQMIGENYCIITSKSHLYCEVDSFSHM